jgi:hypothetical protein
VDVVVRHGRFRPGRASVLQLIAEEVAPQLLEG